LEFISNKPNVPGIRQRELKAHFVFILLSPTDGAFVAGKQIK
jgi:hypothetical protein